MNRSAAEALIQQSPALDVPAPAVSLEDELSAPSGECLAFFSERSFQPSREGSRLTRRSENCVLAVGHDVGYAPDARRHDRPPNGKSLEKRVRDAFPA